MTVSLLAGPTPHLVRRLTPSGTTSTVSRETLAGFAAVDLDTDGQDELVIGRRDGQLLVLQFDPECSRVTVAATLRSVCETQPCELAALTQVPAALAPARLLAVRSAGPFVLLGTRSGAALQLTVHGTSTFNIPVQQWVAAASSANRSQLLLVRPSSAVALSIDNATGVAFISAEYNSSTGLRPLAAWHSAAVLDFAGDGRHVAVLIDNSTSPRATLLSMPELLPLGNGNPQQMDTSYAWSSVAVASLSDAYGTIFKTYGNRFTLILA
jgi:hypothetical protein